MSHEIVPPEPHSTLDVRKAWQYVPRRLRVVLFVIFVAALILIAYLTR